MTPETPVRFSPSLMCMDLLNVESQLKVLNKNFDSLHIDIMDGHFCDSIHLSPSFVKAVRKASRLPIEVHLMVDNPEKYIDSLLESGTNIIILHIESITTRAFRLIDKIHDKGKMAGIALCPITPFNHVISLLSNIDMLIILAVDVGHVGQSLIEPIYDKIKMAKEIKEQNGYKYIIQCDGGVKNSTYRKLFQMGAESFVLGNSALFGKNQDLNIACKLMKSEFTKALS